MDSADDLEGIDFMYNVTRTLDAKGLSCPMPVVRTKKAMEDLAPGEVLEVIVTDRGSIADLPMWAKTTGQEYLELIEENGVLTHYIKKGSAPEKGETTEMKTITNEEYLEVAGQDGVTLIDVREPDEFEAGHAPGAVNIPLGQIDDRLAEIPETGDVYVICRSGGRAGRAYEALEAAGRDNVTRVAPGMGDWDGPVE